MYIYIGPACNMIIAIYINAAAHICIIFYVGSIITTWDSKKMNNLQGRFYIL